MDFYRETFTNAPAVFKIPSELRDRQIEIIILPLDEQKNGKPAEETDENGYPIGFFEQTFGSLPDFPEREPQPPLETREEIE